MPLYRIYTFSEDGHLKNWPKDVTCDNDAAAIQVAESLKDDLDLEVWDSKGRVALITSKRRR